MSNSHNEPAQMKKTSVSCEKKILHFHLLHLFVSFIHFYCLYMYITLFACRSFHPSTPQTIAFRLNINAAFISFHLYWRFLLRFFNFCEWDVFWVVGGKTCDFDVIYSRNEGNLLSTRKPTPRNLCRNWPNQWLDVSHFRECSSHKHSFVLLLSARQEWCQVVHPTYMKAKFKKKNSWYVSTVNRT